MKHRSAADQRIVLAPSIPHERELLETLSHERELEAQVRAGQ